MMKISDALNQQELSRLATITVQVGDVYEITMTEANGIFGTWIKILKFELFILLELLSRRGGERRKIWQWDVTIIRSVMTFLS